MNKHDYLLTAMVIATIWMILVILALPMNMIVYSSTICNHMVVADRTTNSLSSAATAMALCEANFLRLVTV